MQFTGVDTTSPVSRPIVCVCRNSECYSSQVYSISGDANKIKLMMIILWGVEVSQYTGESKTRSHRAA